MEKRAIALNSMKGDRAIGDEKEKSSELYWNSNRVCSISTGKDSFIYVNSISEVRLNQSRVTKVSIGYSRSNCQTVDKRNLGCINISLFCIGIQILKHLIVRNTIFNRIISLR